VLAKDDRVWIPWHILIATVAFAMSTSLAPRTVEAQFADLVGPEAVWPGANIYFHTCPEYPDWEVCFGREGAPVAAVAFGRVAEARLGEVATVEGFT
jgi:hypothetical protein